jgi:hypothetical protein
MNEKVCRHLILALHITDAALQRPGDLLEDSTHWKDRLIKVLNWRVEYNPAAVKVVLALVSFLFSCSTLPISHQFL